MTAMKLLSRAQILGANDVVSEEVPCPEWAPDGTPEAEKAQFAVRIRNLTGTARGVFIQHSLDIKVKEEERAAAEATGAAASKARADFEIEMLLVAMSAVDENNQPMFTRDDLALIGAKSAVPISRCAEVASKLAGIDKAAQEAAAKNLRPAVS